MRFLLKAAQTISIVCQKGGQQLERDPTSESCVLAQIDLPHAADGERSEDRVMRVAAFETPSYM